MKSNHILKCSLSAFLCIVLLVSLNLNTFAASTSCFVNFFKEEFRYEGLNVSTGDVSNGVSSSEGIYNNLHYVKFSFTNATNLYKSLVFHIDLDDLYPSTYYYKFYSESKGSDYKLSFILRSYDSNNNLIDEFNLVNNYFASARVNEHNGSVKVPSYDKDIRFVLTVSMFDDEVFSPFASNFYLYDLDFYTDTSIYGESIENPNHGQLEDNIQNYDDLVDSLPTVKPGELQDILNFDYGSFVDGMNFVRDMFDRTLTALGFNSVLMFGLIFGLASLILGRKAGN